MKALPPGAPLAAKRRTARAAALNSNFSETGHRSPNRDTAPEHFTADYRKVLANTVYLIV